MTRDFDPKLSGSDGGADASDDSMDKKKGSKDTVKVVILLGLVAVAGAVIAYQFLGSKGPKEAEAVVTPGATQPPAVIVQAAATAGAAAPTATRPDQGPLSVAEVEALAQRLDTYMKQRQVPALAVNPFEVALPRGAVGPDGALAAATVEGCQEPAEATAAAAKEPKASAITGRFTLGSVMIIGEKKLAIINGKLCHLGDTIEGCSVATIEAGQVMLTRDGDSLKISLKRDSVASKGN